MIQMCGDNNFENNIYKPEKWSAPIIQMPEELVNYIKAVNIAGRRIKSIHLVGQSYNYTKEWLDNFALTAAINVKDTDQSFPPIIQCVPDTMDMARLILVDTPVIIEFDTGDTLDVLFDRGSEVRMSLNTLPKGLVSEQGGQNVDLDMLFSEIIDKRILGIQVGRRKDLPEDWEQPQGEEWKSQETLIAYILLQMEGGVGLAFEPFNQSGRVFVMGKERKIHNIKFGLLKDALDPKVFEIPEDIKD